MREYTLFFKGISQKVKVIVQLELLLVYLEVVVLHFSYNDTRSPSLIMGLKSLKSKSTVLQDIFNGHTEPYDRDKKNPEANLSYRQTYFKPYTSVREDKIPRPSTSEQVVIKESIFNGRDRICKCQKYLSP